MLMNRTRAAELGRETVAIVEAGRYTTGAGHHVEIGAWGCGVFGNNGQEIAELFRAALSGRFASTFSRAIFAVTDWSPERRFIGPFEDVFGGSISD